MNQFRIVEFRSDYENGQCGEKGEYHQMTWKCDTSFGKECVQETKCQAVSSVRNYGGDKLKKEKRGHSKMRKKGELGVYRATFPRNPFLKKGEQGYRSKDTGNRAIEQRVVER